MTVPHYTRLAAGALRPSDADAAAEVSPESRSAGIAAIERAMELRQQRRRRTRVVAVSAAVAAALLVLGVLSQRVVRGPSVGEPVSAARTVLVRARSAGADSRLVDASGATPLRNGAELVPGRAVVTGTGAGAAFELSTGTRLDVDPHSQLALLDNRRVQRFELRSGAMHARVNKLAPGERFIIGTPDAEVEVHGTAFRVEVFGAGAACAGSQTRVIVTEGVVSVRHAGVLVQIPAGRSWPALCPEQTPAPAPSASAGAAPPAPAVAADAADVHRPNAARAASEPVAAQAPGASGSEALPAASALAEQNGAFGRALAQARAGDRRAALTAFGEFLQQYPSSQLRESAAVEQLRLAIAIEPARARELARAYLQAYPDGAARREAERAVENAP